MLKLFVGEYKKERTFIKYNMLRYTTICIVLDYYCYMNSLGEDVAQSIKFLVDMVLKKSSFHDTKNNRTMIQTVIVNMKMMGLLVDCGSNYLTISNKGKETYINQSYHMAAANLYQANSSRKLAIVAVWISVIGLLLTALIQLINLMYPVWNKCC